MDTRPGFASIEGVAVLGEPREGLPRHSLCACVRPELADGISDFL